MDDLELDGVLEASAALYCRACGTTLLGDDEGRRVCAERRGDGVEE